MVIKSRTGTGAVFTGRVLAHNATGYWFHSLKFDYVSTEKQTGAALSLGSYSNVTKCWFAGTGMGICVVATLGADDSGDVVPKHHINIGWNRFTSQCMNEQGETQIKLQKPDSDAAPHNYFEDIYTYRNFFSGSGSASAGESACFYIGNTKVLDGIYPGMPDRNSVAMFPRVIFEENFISASNPRLRMVYLKNGMEGVYRNRSARTTGGAALVQRHGRGTQFWGNRAASGTSNIGGGGTASLFVDIRRNVGNLDIERGYIVPAGAQHQASDYCSIYANTGTIDLGTFSPSGSNVTNSDPAVIAEGDRLTGAKIYAHVSGTINLGTAAHTESTDDRSGCNP